MSARPHLGATGLVAGAVAATVALSVSLLLWVAAPPSVRSRTGGHYSGEG